MGNVQTGTQCPFPFISSNSTDESEESCTIVYGDDLDPVLVLTQIVMILIFSFCLILATIRLRRLYNATHSLHVAFLANSQVKLYLCLEVMSIGVIISMIDPGGYRNRCPPYVYTIANEFAAASGILAAYFFVDFLMTTAKRANFKEGLPLWITFATIGAVTFNYVGFQVLAVIFSDVYGVFEVLQLAGASLILVFFVILSTKARNDILEVLSRVDSKGDTSLRAAMTCKYPDDIGEGVRVILVTKRKFCQYLMVMVSAIIILTGLLILTLVEEFQYEWTIEYEDAIDGAFIGVKIVYILTAAVVLHIFHIPTGSSRAGTKQSKLITNASQLRSGSSSHVVESIL